jgi:hypothetical protein
VAAAAAVDGGGFRFCGGGRRRRENSGLPFCERCSHHITFGSGLIDDPSPSLVLLLLLLDDMTTGCLGRTERTCTAVFNEVARLVFLFDFLFFFFFFQGKKRSRSLAAIHLVIESMSPADTSTSIGTQDT